MMICLGLPMMLLVADYIITDPFKMLRPFSLDHCSELNRDYLSSELFLRNDSIYHYNSFIFGSSRCCGLNSYHWRHYLPEGSRQFLFQAWGETLTGMVQKMDYIDSNGNDINNVILLLDIPGTFREKQLSQDIPVIKDYRFSGQSQLAFHASLFRGFIQRPSFWVSSFVQWMGQATTCFPADTVTNDWDNSCKDWDVRKQPVRDSLSNCTAKTKAAFLLTANHHTEADLKVSEPLITKAFLQQLLHIKAIFERHHTKYKVIVSPAYCYAHPEINRTDLVMLQVVFGKENVFDYSGKNDITVDCYNFSDPEHFGASVGWQILEDIYNRK